MEDGLRPALGLRLSNARTILIKLLSGGGSGWRGVYGHGGRRGLRGDVGNRGTEREGSGTASPERITGDER